ncbi:MAG: Gfo/Idh/MocA family protein [Candidatus Aminicenantales bacterium]
MEKTFSRRQFLKAGAAAGTGLAIGGMFVSCAPGKKRLRTVPPPFKPAPPMGKVRIGFIGVGGMGTAHVRNLLRIEGAELRAVCDIVPWKVERVQRMCREAGKPIPEGYTRGEYDFKRMCEREDLDLVYSATPWMWHVPMCLEAMNTGKHAAVEVPAALTVEECWQLVETSEKTGKYCIMMENCNYDRIEMMILNMVKKGVLGELIHAECGYLHDLRAVKHDMEGEGLWRRAHSMKRNADLYPTHGLGPVSQCMDINRGNRFDFLVSVSSKSRGLHLYAVERFGPDSPQAREKFVLGDVVTTLIRTRRGETIVLKHDTSSPRPYSRDILVQGTRGIVRKYPRPLVYIEGRSTPHQWEELETYREEFWHPLWKRMEAQTRGAGHGGMDYLEDFRLIEALMRGREPDMDVYDAAAISAVIELSERSIASGSRPMAFPDFTRGMWRKPRELPVMKVSG